MAKKSSEKKCHIGSKSDIIKLLHVITVHIIYLLALKMIYFSVRRAPFDFGGGPTCRGWYGIIDGVLDFSTSALIAREINME